MSELARAQAVRAAIELRTPATTPDQIIEMAKLFEAYIVGEPPRPRMTRLPDKGASSPVARA